MKHRRGELGSRADHWPGSGCCLGGDGGSLEPKKEQSQLLYAKQTLSGTDGCQAVQMKRHRTDRKTGKVAIATVYAVTSRHELPGVEGTYCEVTLAMEERIVGYLQGV